MSVHDMMTSTGLQVSGGLMVTGGIMAQQSHDTAVGAAGVMFGITGLLAAAYPWFSKIMDSIQLARRVTELEANVVAAKAEADRKIWDAKREADLGRAEDRIKADRLVLDLQSEYEKRAAVLEERLGHYETDKRAVAGDLGALRVQAEQNSRSITDLSAPR
jgi:hypothetical protein